MKKILAFAAIGLFMIGIASCNQKGPEVSKEAQQAMDSLSMMLGDQIGEGMAQQLLQDSTINLNEAFKGLEFVANADTSKSFQAGLQMGMYIGQLYQGVQQQLGVPVNQSLFMKHLHDAFTSAKPMSQEEMMSKQGEMQKQQEQIQALQERIMAMSPKAIENKKKGEEYMAKLKKEGYTFTKSGIAYKVLKEGEGKNFTAQDNIKVNYVGKHLDGTEFDRSQEGTPAIFNCDRVVPGFAEMLQLMKPGMKVNVVIPSDLAYGLQGNRGIEANETLIFDLETLGIDDSKPATPKTPQINIPAQPQKK
ncbi:MAG: FKBP-type peptidyl-prolyl cis-trans isomerase [Muribaculaceae bacterium]|nr:FKBP-type peptidyl-prolyl cis-trans isomerase [Muribaculaceae bacterium]